MDNQKNNELFAGYIPVLHDGYIRAFDRHPNAIIGILNNEVISDTKIGYIRKDIRALTPEDAKNSIEGLGRKSIILGRSALELALRSNIIMPDDDITRNIEKLYPEAKITKEPIFLRWDRDNSNETSVILPDREVTLEDDDKLIQIISNEASKSSNWWRHVSAALVDSSKIILCKHNHSLPTEHTSWIEGDPRITAKKGESIERSIDIHAEASLIAQAARDGISLNGKDIYVSTFPCPNCAKLIALSGVKSCYFIEGYAVLDGQSILSASGVEIVKINTRLNKEDQNILKLYPEK